MKRPISVTGTSTPSLRNKGLRSHRGFTLWELLIVVAIITLTTVVAIEIAPSIASKDRELERLGKDLGKLFNLLSQEAVFENRNYAVSVFDEGFVILEYREGQWSETGESFLKKFKMGDTQRSALYLEDKLIDTERKAEPPPHILILSSGEMTPFEWRISDDRINAGIVLQGNFLGSVLMTGPEPLS